MSFSVDLLSLLLYCVQQFGVVLGVGAQSIMLLSYIIAARDGIIDQKETQFGKAVNYVLMFGLFAIISSGIAITVLHLSLGEGGVVGTPAYIFKWMLICGITILTLAMAKNPLNHSVWEGLLGSQWYALFILHMLAPVAHWQDLLALYVLFTIGFMFLWSVIVYSLQTSGGKPKHPMPNPASNKTFEKPMIKSEQVFAVKPEPPPKVPSPPPPSVVVAKVEPKPAQTHANLPVVTKPVLPVVVETKVAQSTSPVLPKKPVQPVMSVPLRPPRKPVPQKPIEVPEDAPLLPTIRVMPQTPEQIGSQNRPGVIQFE